MKQCNRLEWAFLTAFVLLALCTATATPSRSGKRGASAFGSSFSHSCSSDQFACHDGRRCIPESARCDGTDDCTYGEDEQDCSRAVKASEDSSGICKIGHILCGDRSACIVTAYKCDGQEDCNDGSDESGCGDLETTNRPAESHRRNDSDALMSSSIGLKECWLIMWVFYRWQM